MARVVVDGMLEAAGDEGRGGKGGLMLNRWRSKARRKKRKELFGVQMCFAGAALGLVAGLQCVAHIAGSRASTSKAEEEARRGSRHLLHDVYSEPEKNCTEPAYDGVTGRCWLAAYQYYLNFLVIIFQPEADLEDWRVIGSQNCQRVVL